MESDIDRSGLQQLAAVYGLLARLWLKEVDSSTLRAIAEPQLAEVWQSLGGFVPDRSDETAIDELAVDYCQLLIGPSGHVSPVQSIWMENKFQGAAASSMQHFFELLPEYKPASTIKDHIGNQFDYLGELFARAATNDHPETYTSVAANFFASHMEWTTNFLDEVENKAGTEFYKGLARLTRNFLNQ